MVCGVEPGRRRARRGPLELVAAQEDAEGHQPLNHQPVNHQQLFNPVIEPQGKNMNENYVNFSDDLYGFGVVNCSY